MNENGQGAPLSGDGPIVARPPFGPPDAPGIPDVTKVGEDFVNLTWERPKSDGGSRIMGYFIDKREAGMEVWQRCNQNPVPQNIYNVPNLIEGRKYEFRVFAVNAAGLSPPSSNTSPVVVQPSEGEYSTQYRYSSL